MNKIFWVKNCKDLLIFIWIENGWFRVSSVGQNTYILSKEACFISIIKLDDLLAIEFSKITPINYIYTLISVRPKS